MPALILTTKLYIPQPRPDLVARPQLIERLNQGLHRKLTLISAPAGFGKTTLVSNWLTDLRLNIDDLRLNQKEIVSHQSEIQNSVAWLSLDPADDDPARFLAYFLAALSQADPALEQAFDDLQQTARQASLENVMPTLINKLAASQTKIILVLDDYHLIQNQSIHNALIFLLDHLPPQLHLVLTGRADPTFSLVRFRARGQITEIRTDDLRFSAQEAAIFLHQVMAIDLSPDDVIALETRTEGWIAGLQMAALSMQGRADLDRFIADFTGSHRYIFDYLAEEALARRPKGTRDFLLQTAVLDRLCASLCDAVLDSQGSQFILEQLEAANLFLIPLDDERRWYRYHHLFADLLRQFLRRELPSQELKRHSRASRWFEQAEYANEAVEHALKAGELERAAALIEPIAHGMAYRMEIETLGRWVEALPEDLLLQYPGIVYPYAIVLSVTGRFDEYHRYLEKTELAAQVNINKREAQIILGQVGVQKSIRLHLFGDYEQALQQVADTQAILRQYDQPDERWELISIVGYSTIHIRGNVETALAYLNRATRLGTADEGSIGALLCNTFTANAYFYLGRLHQAEASLQTALQAVTLPDGTKLFHAVFPSALRARLAYERNQLDEAAQYVDAYLPLTNITGFTTDPVDTLFVGTMLPLAQGDPDQAVAILKQTEQQFQTLPISAAFTLRLAAIKALLWLRVGYIQPALQWANSVEIPENSDHIQPFLTFPYLVWVRIQLAQQNFAAADSFLARLRSWTETEVLDGIVLETATLQALSAYAQNNIQAALDQLNTALTLAAPEGYTRLFLDEGEPMLKLLRQAVRKGVGSNYVRLLLTAFEGEDTEKTLTLVDPRSSSSRLVEPLTDREVELLHLLAEGLTNQEIATRLYIAVSTVKRHAANIYGKLGVRNRTEAVAKARELDILR